jgi:hypothetical protein
MKLVLLLLVTLAMLCGAHGFVLKIDPNGDIAAQLAAGHEKWSREGMAREIVFAGNLYRVKEETEHGRTPNLPDNMHDYAPVFSAGVPAGVLQTLVVTVDASTHYASPATVLEVAEEQFWRDSRRERARRPGGIPDAFRVLPERRREGEPSEPGATFVTERTRYGMVEFMVRHYHRGRLAVAVALSVITQESAAVAGGAGPWSYRGYTTRNLGAWAEECRRVAEWIAEAVPGLDRRQEAHLRAFRDMDAKRPAPGLSEAEIDALFATSRYEPLGDNDE